MAHAISPVSQCCVSGETGAYSDRSVGWAAGLAVVARVGGGLEATESKPAAAKATFAAARRDLAATRLASRRGV